VGLGLWTLPPVLGAVALGAIASRLHEGGCGGSLNDEALGVVFQILLYGGVLAMLAGAVFRLTREGGSRVPGHPALRPALVALVPFAVAGAVVVARHFEPLVAFIFGLFAGSFFYGLLLTAAAFLVLIAMVLRCRAVEEAGIITPLYLIGCSLLVYLPILFLASLRVGGCFE